MSMFKIQGELKAPKGQFNSFGKYKYRSCEDIVEAVKPVLDKYKYYLSMSDEIVEVGGRVYVKAICSVMDESAVVSTSTAFAREPENKKGMDESQITGTASSYARKYALNGLFAIDDTKDADSNEQGVQQAAVKKVEKLDTATVLKFEQCESMAELQAIWGGLDKSLHTTYNAIKNEAKARLTQ